jgi:S1-C subfamily serine protease
MSEPGNTQTAKLIGTDSKMDIALLKIDADENSLTQHLGIPIL